MAHLIVPTISAVIVGIGGAATPIFAPFIAKLLQDNQEPSPQPEPVNPEPTADFTYTFDRSEYGIIICSQNPDSFIANKTYCFVMDLSTMPGAFPYVFPNDYTWYFQISVSDDWPDPSNFTYEVWMNGQKQQCYPSQTEEQGTDGYYLNPDVSPGQIISGYHKYTKPKVDDLFHIYLTPKTDYLSSGISLFFGSDEFI